MLWSQLRGSRSETVVPVVPDSTVSDPAGDLRAVQHPADAPVSGWRRPDARREPDAVVGHLHRDSVVVQRDQDRDRLGPRACLATFAQRLLGDSHRLGAGGDRQLELSRVGRVSDLPDHRAELEDVGRGRPRGDRSGAPRARWAPARRAGRGSPSLTEGDDLVDADGVRGPAGVPPPPAAARAGASRRSAAAGLHGLVVHVRCDPGAFALLVVDQQAAAARCDRVSDWSRSALPWNRSEGQGDVLGPG